MGRSPVPARGTGAPPAARGARSPPSSPGLLLPHLHSAPDRHLKSPLGGCRPRCARPGPAPGARMRSVYQRMITDLYSLQNFKITMRVQLLSHV